MADIGRDGDRRDLMGIARQNERFREVISTGDHLQVVVMTLQPGEEIGVETHPGTDQWLLLVDGQATVTLDGEEVSAAGGEQVLVAAGTRHNVVATGAQPLRLITVYSPPEHPHGTVHETKAEADAAEH